MKKAAIVILNWNGKDLLDRFLPNVITYSPSDIADIIIADNGSDDDSVKFVNDKYPNIEVIQLDKNYGFAGGYNKALENVKAEYFILLNSDVEVTSGWLEPLIDNLDSNAKYSACMPVIRAYHYRNSFEYAGASGGFIDKYGYPFCRGRVFETLEKDDGQYPDNTDVFWASGACLVIKSDIFKSMNGFDSDFFAHMEEIDLCWRMKNQGYKINIVTSSIVYHVGGGTLPNESPNKLFLNFRNSLYMLYKNLPSSSFRILLFKRKILDGVAAIKFLLTLKFGYFMAVVKAHIAYTKSIPDLKRKRSDLESKRVVTTHSEIYNRSLVLSYFLRGKKLFTDLDF